MQSQVFASASHWLELPWHEFSLLWNPSKELSLCPYKLFPPPAMSRWAVVDAERKVLSLASLQGCGKRRGGGRWSGKDETRNACDWSWNWDDETSEVGGLWAVLDAQWSWLLAVCHQRSHQAVSHSTPKNWFLSRCSYFHDTKCSGPSLILTCVSVREFDEADPRDSRDPVSSWSAITLLSGFPHTCLVVPPSPLPSLEQSIGHAGVLCDWTLYFLILFFPPCSLAMK